MSSGPYEITWLNSGYHETLLPNSPWHKIESSINTALAQEVKHLALDSELHLCIIKLLGSKFVNEYLIHKEINQSKLQSLSENEEVQIKANQWLNEKMEMIVEKLKLQRIEGNEGDDANISPVMMEYKRFVHQVVHRGMDRELTLAENKENSLHTQAFAVSSMISGPQSEALGNAISSVLNRHPSQLQRVSRQLTGRQLPNNLRQLLWKIKIYKAEGFHLSELEDHIDNLRQEFVTAVKWGEKELGITEPVSSTVDGVIKHAVREIYNMVPCIQDGNMRHVCVSIAIQALNILYVHSRMYEAHYALILLPLIWTHIGYTPNKEFTSTDLSEMLYFLLQNCFPTRLQIFAIADCVVNSLERDDPVLFAHIVMTMQKNIAFDPREFLVNFIHHEKEKATALAKQAAISHSGGNDDDESRSLLSHPIIFMRKWIGEGFVGILDFPAVLFVWDQCFLGDWQPSILENVCLVLLELLRSKLLQANDYNDIKTILLNHVYSLHTYDIQQGLVHLNNGGSLLDVNGLRQASAVPSQVDDTPNCDNKLQNSPPDEDIQLGELWVEKRQSSSNQILTNTESFHVYVDEVRFIPDNATVVKVTGRILNPLWKKPSSLDISDVEAYSILDSPARCPQFHYRYPVHSQEGVPHNSVLLLRVYTLDVDSGEMVVIGNCALDLYKEEEPDKYVLNTGGHQLRIKHELPSTVSKLSEELFYQLTNIPVISLLIRILPYTEDFIDPPGYSSGFYNSIACTPDETEKRLYNHYKELQPYPPTVIEAIRDIREEELNAEDEEVTDQQMEQWYRQRMSKQQLERKPARPLPLTRLVQYDQAQGLYFTVDQAFSLPSPVFINVLAHVSLGPDARSKGKTSDGHGGDESALFDKRDFDSLQKSPKWINDPKRFHPHLDSVSSLVIQLFGLDAVYEPTPDRQAPGTVAVRKGKTMRFVPQGWTVLKLFDKKSVNAGVHHVPLLEGKPSSSFMEFLLSQPGDVGLREAIRQDIHQLQGSSSIQVCIWDGHYTNGDYLPLPTKQDLLTIGNQAKIQKAMQVSTGKKQSDVILQCLSKQERKLGIDGHPYIEEKQHYEEAMNVAFSSLMDNVLLDMGLGPSSHT